MPLYVYHCPDCDGDTELVRSIKLRDLPVRCDCGALARRQVSQPAEIRFRGSGWTRYGAQTLDSPTHKRTFAT